MTIHYIERILKEKMDENFHILSNLKVTHEEKTSLLIPKEKMVGLKGTTFLHE